MARVIYCPIEHDYVDEDYCDDCGCEMCPDEHYIDIENLRDFDIELKDKNLELN